MPVDRKPDTVSDIFCWLFVSICAFAFVVFVSLVFTIETLKDTADQMDICKRDLAHFEHTVMEYIANSAVIEVPASDALDENFYKPDSRTPEHLQLLEMLYEYWAATLGYPWPHSCDTDDHTQMCEADWHKVKAHIDVFHAYFHGPEYDRDAMVLIPIEIIRLIDIVLDQPQTTDLEYMELSCARHDVTTMMSLFDPDYYKLIEHQDIKLMFNNSKTWCMDYYNSRGGRHPVPVTEQ